MAATASGNATNIEHRMVQGREAKVYTHPDKLHIEWRPGRPVYFGVRVGDCIKNAGRDIESAHITEWEVVEITPETVVGVNQKTGDRTEWDRVDLEQGLILNQYATNLSEFATVAVHTVGTWPSDEATRDPRSKAREPCLGVVAFGNNGEKYGRRYRFTTPGETTEVELLDQDPSIDRLSPDLQAALEETVVRALKDDGHRVR